MGEASGREAAFKARILAKVCWGDSMRGETKTKVIRVRVSPRILAYLRKIAYRKRRTVSEVVRKFILEGIKGENVLHSE